MIIKLHPDSVLITPCESFIFGKKNDYNYLKSLVKTMNEIMVDAKGIGLAANQVGCNKRVAIIDVPVYTSMLNGKRVKLTLINPEIIEKNQLVMMQEGCLSLPEQVFEVTRFNSIKVKYQTVEGQYIVESYYGLPAQAIQHECDHLNGRLINGAGYSK